MDVDAVGLLCWIVERLGAYLRVLEEGEKVKECRLVSLIALTF